MEKMIDNLSAEFKGYLEDFRRKADISIDSAEVELTEKVNGMICRFLGALYEAKDEEIYTSKARRRAAGMAVERRHDRRDVLSIFGTVSYERTYYKKASGGYEYPVDAIAGIKSYARISEGCSAALVDCACRESYETASQEVVGGNISKQTVMNMIRKTRVPDTVPHVEKRKVPVLHIDADEDHVALQHGGNTEVMAATVYEGVRRVGKTRNECVNAFSISEYGKTPEEFWKKVYAEMDARYDLDKVQVYLHSDGAGWILKGLDWLPMGTKQVLDRYHVNQYILEAVSGLEEPDRTKFRQELYQSLKEDDSRYLKELSQSMLESYPDRRETIAEGTGYLIRHFDAIHIRYTDENARCGSSEPHIQHILSRRLSSVPMGWSKTTLKHFAPLLAARAFTFEPEQTQMTDEVLSVREVFKTPHAKTVLHSRGLPDPDNAIFLPSSAYKRTTLSKTLRVLSKSLKSPTTT